MSEWGGLWKCKRCGGRFSNEEGRALGLLCDAEYADGVCEGELVPAERHARPDLLRELVNGLSQSIDAELAASAGLSRDYPNLYNMLNNWHGDICSALGEPANEVGRIKAAWIAERDRLLEENRRLNLGLLSREERIRELEAALEQADGIMDVCLLKGIGDWLDTWPETKNLWAGVHEQIHAALRGPSKSEARRLAVQREGKEGT